MFNHAYRAMILPGKIKYLKKLIEVSKGSRSPVFLKEGKQLVLDTGIETAKAKGDLPFIELGESKAKVQHIGIA